MVLRATVVSGTASFMIRAMPCCTRDRSSPCASSTSPSLTRTDKQMHGPLLPPSNPTHHHTTLHTHQHIDVLLSRDKWRRRRATQSSSNHNNRHEKQSRAHTVCKRGS